MFTNDNNKTPRAEVYIHESCLIKFYSAQATPSSSQVKAVQSGQALCFGFDASVPAFWHTIQPALVTAATPSVANQSDSNTEIRK